MYVYVYVGGGGVRGDETDLVLAEEAQLLLTGQLDAGLLTSAGNRAGAETERRRKRKSVCACVCLLCLCTTKIHRQ